jgi:hypothetical protein
VARLARRSRAGGLRRGDLAAAAPAADRQGVCITRGEWHYHSSLACVMAPSSALTRDWA